MFLKIVKWLIHIPALLLSLVMVIDTLSGISIEPFWRNFFIGCAIYAELFGQFVRGLAAAYRRNNQQIQTILCWILVGIYIGVFAGVSAVGVFMTKISTEEQKIQVNTDNKGIARDNYDRTRIELENKIAEQNIEYNQNGGIGEKYKALGKDIEKLKEDLIIYSEQLKNENQIITHTHKNVFLIFPIWIRIPMFCAIMIIIYTGLLLTPWPIDLKILHNENFQLETLSKNETAMIINETVNNNHNNNIKIPVSIVKKNRYCQHCGKILSDTMRSDAKFCDDNCRLEAFRQKEG